MSTETLRELTPEELDLLLSIVNTTTPKLASYDLHPMDLRLIHGWKLKEIFGKAESKLKDEEKVVVKSIIGKLGMS